MDIQTLFHPSVNFSPSKSFHYWLKLNRIGKTIMPSLLRAIRDIDDEDILRIATTIIRPDSLPVEYLQSLPINDLALSLRACLAVYTITLGKFLPRVFQLQATLETMRGRDSIVIAGTGSGKTMCIVIPLLLEPNCISVTISPLKRLQMMQVCQQLSASI